MKNKTKTPCARQFISFCCCCLAALPCAFAQIETSSYIDSSAYAATADSLVKIGKKEEALSFLLRSKEALEMRDSQKTGDYLNVLRTLGFFYFDNWLGLVETRRYLGEAEELLKKIEPSNKVGLAFLWHVTGRSYYYDEQPNKARPIFEKSLPLWHDAFGEYNENTARCYKEMALCYSEAGNYEKSISYIGKARRSLENSPSGKNHPSLGAYIYNLGYIYFSKGDFNLALKYLKEALDTAKIRLGNHRSTALCLSMLGSTHASLGNGAKAVEYQLLALEMFKKALTPEEYYLSACYEELGLAYNINRQYPQSLDYYKKALFCCIPKGESRPPRPDLFFGMANTYRKIQNSDEALLCIDTALTQLNYTDSLQLDSLLSRILTYQALLLKASIVAEKYSKGERDIAHLKTAGDLLSDAKTIILARIGAFYQEKNKLAFYRRAIDGNNQAIEVYTRLYSATGDPAWLHSAFEYAEISKSLLLYQSVLENKARRKFAVPDSLSNEEETLQKSIAETKKVLFDLSKKSPTRDSIEGRLSLLDDQYESLRRSIEAICPDYFAAASSFPNENIENIQADLLDDSTALLEYFTSDSTLCIFLLRSDTFFFHQARIDSSFKKQVEQMRLGIYGYYTTREKAWGMYLQTAKLYVENATALYQQLIAPLANQLPPKLVIVPDGVLGYLPFEALLSGRPERPDRFHRHPYLVLKHDISYCFSAALLREMKTLPPAAASDNLLAMAPFYKGAGIWGDSLFAFGKDASRAALHPLPHTGEEVYRIAKTMNGSAVVGQEAKKAEFIRLAPGFRILHLATHGRANDYAGEFSFLAFPASTDSLKAEQLTVGEIYTLRLNADLITLSACETGLGQLHRGEGIVSLSRAFASAGTKSIVHSLWTVNDAGTKTLMEYFYRNLRRGLPKDAALRQAKLSYLEKFRGEDAHPFFWSGFVLVGDSSPLQF